MFYFLPLHISNMLNELDLDNLTEIRIRTNHPIIINYYNRKYFLGTSGPTNDENKSIIATKQDVDYVILTLTEKSLYAYNDNIKLGFLTSKSGVRVGICGTCVFEHNNIITIKNIESLCIRIPHEIVGCSDELFEKLLLDKRKNVLIISPPGYGKTTLLKDLIRNYNNKTNFNLLVVDERNELRSCGCNVDTIKHCNKQYAINVATRSMSPDIIFMDELMNIEDYKGVEIAKYCGVNVISTIHAETLKDVISKFNNASLIFDYFILLNKGDKPGELKAIYDNNLNEI